MRWSPAWLIVCASFLFASMGVCVKLASAQYSAGEIVLYRGLTGAIMMIGLARWQRGTIATRLPAMHFWRSVSGVVSLVLWFYALGNLPLATAMTLNYMSSVWMAHFSTGGVAAGALLIVATGMHAHTWHGAVLLLAVGVLATIAQLMMTRAYSTGPTLVNASLQYLGIAWSFAYGVLLFDDRVTVLALSGMLLIVAAGLSATLLRSRSGRPQVAAIADPPNTV
jgi:drug/metabolite transporter (DMT)-like permease